VESELSFEEYAKWCCSRRPPIDHREPKRGIDTVPMGPNDEACPVTVRSVRDGYVLVTPTPKGSK
jgi:hypothetical protein